MTEALARPADEGPSVGIVDAQVVLPWARPRGRRGRVAAAAHDEDVVTLAADAAQLLLERTATAPAALLLATTSSGLTEGGVAQSIAELTGLAGSGLHVAEQAGTTAAGLSAVATAMGLLALGRGPVLLLAADDRRDGRGRPLGAGAVALLLDDDDGPCGRLRWLDSCAALHRDHWRTPGDVGLQHGDRSLAVLADPWRDPPWDVAAVRAVVICDPLGPIVDGAGALGCAAPLVGALLAAADATPEQRVVAAVAAGGIGHAVELTVGPAGPAVGQAVAAVLAQGGDEAPAVPGELSGFDPFASGPRAYRERGLDLRLEAQRDPATGEVLFPPVPAAAAAAAGLEATRLARQGTVVTLTRDHVFPHGGPIQMVVVDVDGGGRFYGQAVPEAPPLTIGEEVVLVPRRLYDVDGVPQHYYKVAPAAQRPPVPANET